MIRPLSWSHIAHVVGDMRDDEEFKPVRVLLPDGSLNEVVSIEKDAAGQWQMIARLAVAKTEDA